MGLQLVLFNLFNLTSNYYEPGIIGNNYSETVISDEVKHIRDKKDN